MISASLANTPEPRAAVGVNAAAANIGLPNRSSRDGLSPANPCRFLIKRDAPL
jgi:hypothetical protein